MRYLWDRARNPWKHGKRGRTISPNVGVATGSKSDVWVLDLDIRPEKGEDGLSVIHEVAGGCDYETAAQRTGSGSWQLLYAWPDEWQLGDRTIRSRTRLLPGIDVRAEGGIAVLPPSLHESGKRYEWVVDHSPIDFEPTPAPEWLLDLVAGPFVRDASRVNGRESSRSEASNANTKGGNRPTASKLDQVVSALEQIPSDGYDDWLRVGMALHSTGWSFAFDAWCVWSEEMQRKARSKYCLATQHRTWRSFKRGGVGLGTIFHLAEARRAKRVPGAGGRAGGGL